MRISKRLYKITEKVSKGESVADIGTDHGYVPMLLIRDDISPRVIMSDISEGSLSKAEETFRLCGIDVDPDCFRLGDGLETVVSGEVDDIIIAGLGGFTITKILSSDIEKSRSFRKLILQPRKHSGNLRYFLYTRGWDIIDEDLAPEGKFVCEIITAVPNTEAITSESNDEINYPDDFKDVLRKALYPENDIRWKYPADIVNADYELAYKRIGWKIGSIKEQIENLKKSSSDRSDLIEELETNKAYLESILSTN